MNEDKKAEKQKIEWNLEKRGYPITIYFKMMMIELKLKEIWDKHFKIDDDLDS